MLVATVAAHAAVLTALVLVAFWKIDKLPVNDDRAVTISVATAPPPAPSPPPGGALEVIKRPIIKTPPPVDVQPTIVKEPTPPDPTTGTTGTGTPDGTGTDPDGTGTDPTGVGTCTVEPCGGDPEPRTKPVVEVKKIVPPQPVVLPPNVAAGLRISGNEKIYPPDAVRVAMVHGGEDKLQGTIKLCVGTNGSVDSVKVLKSTGHDAYDAALVSAMRSWRYRPYQVNGSAVPMCTVEIVIYRMTR